MAENLMSLAEVCKQLQLSEEQVKNLVKSGALRGLRDQKSLKFRPADVQAYKTNIESGKTTIADTGGESESEMTDLDSGLEIPADAGAGMVDLVDIEAEPGADESDQTSVLAPPDEAQASNLREDSPVFDFSEDDLGLSLDEEPAVEEADQTSLLTAADGGIEQQEESPVFEFAQKEGAPVEADESKDSVLIADESESSLDILEVAEESSSDAGSSGTDLAIAEISDEGSSGEGIAALAEVEEASSEEAVSAEAGAAPTIMDTDTVMDILSEVEESSDEVLETLDLDETAGPEQPAETIEVAPPVETAETIPLSDGIDTAAIAVEEDEGTSLAEGVLEGAELEGIEGEEVVTEAEELEAAPMVTADWEIVVPSKLGNAFLIAAILMSVVGCVFVLCELNELDNSFTRAVINFVKQSIG